jgi:2-phospho-L-lactate transferase/gluconeogenesis factor (CofD/UPF0052 family)
VVFNCNLVNKKGHTEKFTLDDYVDAMNKYLGKQRINFVTFNSLKPPEKLVKRYQKKKEFLIPFLRETRSKRNYKIILTPLLNIEQLKFSKADHLSEERSFIRHDPDKLAKTLMFLLEIEENKNFIKAII